MPIQVLSMRWERETPFMLVIYISSENNVREFRLLREQGSGIWTLQDDFPHFLERNFTALQRFRQLLSSFSRGDSIEFPVDLDD